MRMCGESWQIDRSCACVTEGEEIRRGADGVSVPPSTDLGWQKLSDVAERLIRDAREQVHAATRKDSA
jgi:hypothetical protein